MNEEWTWSSEWLNPPMQSSWGILERFKYVNLMTDIQIKKYLTLDSKAQDTQTISWDIAKIRSIFGSLSWLDDTKFKEIFVRRIFDDTVKENTMIRFHLSWCPMCLKNGIHSYWHQYRVFKTCPIHNVVLMNKCRNCGAKIPHNPTFHRIRESFTCFCGYPLTDGIIEWREWSKEQLSIHSIKLLQDIYDKLLYNPMQLRKIICLPDSFIDSDYQGFKVLSKTMGNGKNNELVKYININVDEVQLFKFIDDLDNKVFVRFKQIYSSVMRHFRKKWVKGHIKCIDINAFNTDGNICPAVYSYTAYRADRECTRMVNVDRLRRARRYKAYNIFSISQNNQLFYITKRWYKLYGNSKDNIKQNEKLLNLLSAVFALTIYYEFFEWLNTCLNANSKLPIRDGSLEIWNKNPIYLIELETLQIHLIKDKNLINLQHIKQQVEYLMDNHCQREERT